MRQRQRWRSCFCEPRGAKAAVLLGAGQGLSVGRLHGTCRTVRVNAAVSRTQRVVHHMARGFSPLRSPVAFPFILSSLKD